MRTTKPSCPALVLRVTSVLLLSAGLAANARAEQQGPHDLLLKIMDLHSQLVTNETFLAQAKMIGAYLEAAQSLDDPNKVETYTKVLDLLTKIKDSATQETASSSKKQRAAESPKQKGKVPFLPGSALLEVFKVDNSGNTAEVPVIKTSWSRDLSHKGMMSILPDRTSEIGPRGTDYAARFSFYYEAKVAGKYGFNLGLDGGQSMFSSTKGAKLTVGNVPVLAIKAGEGAGQGICDLEPGFHRIEFLWLDEVRGQNQFATGFAVRVLTPDAPDSVLITKDMLLMKTRE